jgi:hypothetical protein
VSLVYQYLRTLTGPNPLSRRDCVGRCVVLCPSAFGASREFGIRGFYRVES